MHPQEPVNYVGTTDDTNCAKELSTYDGVWKYAREYCIGENCKGYRGLQTKTTSGLQCQDWGSQSPNKHSRTPGSKYDDNVDGSLGDGAFCRSPDSAKDIWCYSANGVKPRWEYCDPLSQAEINEGLKNVVIEEQKR